VWLFRFGDKGVRIVAKRTFSHPFTQLFLDDSRKKKVDGISFTKKEVVHLSIFYHCNQICRNVYSNIMTFSNCYLFPCCNCGYCYTVLRYDGRTRSGGTVVTCRTSVLCNVYRNMNILFVIFPVSLPGHNSRYPEILRNLV